MGHHQSSPSTPKSNIVYLAMTCLSGKCFLVLLLFGTLVSAQPVLPETDRATIPYRSQKPGAPIEMNATASVSEGPDQPVEVILTFTPLISPEDLTIQIHPHPKLSIMYESPCEFKPPYTTPSLTCGLSVSASENGQFHLSLSAQLTANKRTQVRPFIVPINIGEPTIPNKKAFARNATSHRVILPMKEQSYIPTNQHHLDQ